MLATRARGRRIGEALGVAGALVLLVLAPRAAVAERVVETWPDGSPRCRYHLDSEGRRHGVYTEFHPNGKVAVRTRYRQGVLNGVHTTFHVTGKKKSRSIYRRGALVGRHEEWDEAGDLAYTAPYRDGARHGRVEAWKDGEPLATQVWDEGRLVEMNGTRLPRRTKEEVREALADILGEDAGPGDVADPLDATRALRRLRAYRYVCGVPWEDVVLDEGLSRYAQAASEICAAIGRITHEPPDPGWDPARYDVAARGARNSNLHTGPRANDSVDGYMDDSDASNIDRVGHRCWCLNPALKRTGFGAVRDSQGQWFTAMYSTDRSRGKDQQAVAVIGYPAGGWMPIDLFGARHAWSVHLRKKDVPRIEARKVRVAIHPLDDRMLPLSPPLRLDQQSVRTDAPGLGVCVIFRPADLVLEDGAVYWVVLSGLDGEAEEGADDRLCHVVRFFDRGR